MGGEWKKGVTRVCSARTAFLVTQLAEIGQAEANGLKDTHAVDTWAHTTSKTWRGRRAPEHSSERSVPWEDQTIQLGRTEGTVQNYQRTASTPKKDAVEQYRYTRVDTTWQSQEDIARTQVQVNDMENGGPMAQAQKQERGWCETKAVAEKS